MNIYKRAQQIQFSNEEQLKIQIQRVRDSEFKTYISTLSQIHSDLQVEDFDLESVVEDNVGSAFSVTMLKLLDNIGVDLFVNSQFSLIREGLEELRADTPEVDEPDATQVVRPELINIHENNGELLEGVEGITTLLSFPPEKRFEYLSGLDYPESKRENSKVVLRSLKIMEENYSNPDQTDGFKTYIYKEIVDAVGYLLSLMAEEEEAEAEEEEETEGEEASLSDIKFPTQNKDLDSIRKPNDNRELYSPNNSIGAEVDDDSLLEHKVYTSSDIDKVTNDDKNVYVNYSSDIPVIDHNAITSAYGNFMREVNELWARTMTGSKITAGRDLKREFNLLVYSIKKVDYEVYKDFLDRKSKVSSEYLKDYEVIGSELAAWLPSQQVLEDESSFSTLSLVALTISSPKVAFLTNIAEEEQFLDELTNLGFPPEVDQQMIMNTMRDSVTELCSKKMRAYLDLELMHGGKNILKTLGLRMDHLVKSVKSKMMNLSKTEYRPCPTCFKYIKWNPKSVEDSNFSIKLYSFFTGDESRPKITEEYLKSKKWPAPPPTEYSNSEREQKKAMKYAEAGEKSWEEITAMLNSSDKALQEEGWHRRAGALKAAGGLPLVTAPIKVSGFMSRCPVSSSGESECGVSFQPTIGSGLDSLSLQPSWDGTKSYKLDVKESRKTLGEELWENKELFRKSKELGGGGYKFSRVNFACTCRINNITDITAYKHGNVAISLAGVSGSEGFVYPTKPDGSLDKELGDGTLSFLVCGAPTSLTSFERSKDNSGYILSHFKNIKDESFDDYRIMINFLIRHGLAVEDAMFLDNNLDKYNEALSESTMEAKSRIDRISELIKSSQIKIKEDSDMRRLWEGLTLVCPFGHRFKIGHSLRFGEAYSGIFKKKAAITYSNLITTEGSENIKAILSGTPDNVRSNFVLVPAEDPEVSGFEKLHFDEWKKREDRVVYPIPSKRDRPILIFSLPVDSTGEKKDFVFYKGFSGLSSKNIWSPLKSYRTPALLQKFDKSNSEYSAPLLTQGDGSASLEGTGRTLFDVASFEQFKSEDDEIVGSEYNHPPSVSIPGTTSVYTPDDQIDSSAFGKKVEAFSRAITSCLRVIEVRTKSIVSNKMVDVLFEERKVDISPYSGSLERALRIMESHLEMDSFDDDGEDIPVTAGERTALMGVIRKEFINFVNRKAESLSDYIRSHIYSIEGQTLEFEISKEVIKASIMEMIGQMYDYGNSSIYFNIPKASMDSTADSLATEIAKSSLDIRQEIVQGSKKQLELERRKTQYLGRILMVSYAHYLAESLSTIYKKYCSSSSPLYIGYNIGIDLSSPNKIFGSESNGQWVGGISEQEISNIVSTEEEALAGGSLEKVPGHTLRYEDRIDRAWQELEGYLSKARREASSSRNMERAKKYIISRMSYISGEEAKDISANISEVFPVKSILFNGTTEKPETAITLITKGRLPLLASKKGVNVTMSDVPGTKVVKDWLLRNINTGKIYTFGSEEEANLKKQEMLAKDPSSNFEVRPDFYWVNDSLGFDSSKLQIGITAPKTATDIKWPPEKGRLNFVGINLPFKTGGIKDDASVNKAKVFPIRDYKFVIDFDGTPLDISFLLRKGRSIKGKKLSKSEEKSANSMALKEMAREEAIIKNAYKIYHNNIELFKIENDQAIKEDEKVLSRFIAEEEEKLNLKVEPALRTLDTYPLSISTSKSYYDAGLKAARPMIRVNLEDPITAYNIIMNPCIRGVSLTKEEQDLYIDFIIRVYNINKLSEYCRSYSEGVKRLSHFSGVTPRKLLSEPEKFSISSRDMLKKKVWKDQFGEEQSGYFSSPGEYFSVIPGNQDFDRGSYMQYVYSGSLNSYKYLREGTHPSISQLCNTAVYIKNQNLDADLGKGGNLSLKIEKDTLEYIRSRTSGERRNPALDGRKQASEYSKNILLRRSKLERIILLPGMIDVDDVEMPKY